MEYCTVAIGGRIHTTAGGTIFMKYESIFKDDNEDYYPDYVFGFGTDDDEGDDNYE